MKTIGLIGGTTWVSTVDYYRLLNEEINRRCGGQSSARCVLHSFNFAEIKELQDRGAWQEILQRVTIVARRLAGAGAECVMLCANAMHAVADDLRINIDVPVIHIAEATARAIGRRGISRVGLIGTRYTMEMDFFKNKLTAQGISAIVPSSDDREFIHETIFSELAHAVFTAATRERYLAIMNGLAASGAEGIILGCTEIPLLVKQADTPLPLFDTVAIHVDEGVQFALSDRA